METINLSVSGMTCSACVKHVEKAINAIPSVNKVEVDLALGTVKIEGNVSQRVQEIIAVLNEEGYPAIVNTSGVSKTISGTCKSGSSCCCH